MVLDSMAKTMAIISRQEGEKFPRGEFIKTGHQGFAEADGLEFLGYHLQAFNTLLSASPLDGFIIS